MTNHLEVLRLARDYVADELSSRRGGFEGYEHLGGVKNVEADLARIDAAIASLSAPQSGDWVLVPRNPTTKMLDAAHDADTPATYSDIRLIWEAMLAAASQPAAPDISSGGCDGSSGHKQPPAEAQPVAWVSRNDAMFTDAGNWRCTNPLLYSSQESPSMIPLYTAPPSAPVDDCPDCTNSQQCASCSRDEQAVLEASAPQPPAEAHCATCSCVPGMTPTVRFNTTPAEQEGAVRDHLIRMGWTPPSEAQPVAFDRRFADMLVGVIGDVQDELGFTDEDKACSNGSAEIVAAIRELKERAHPPPSAPVGKTFCEQMEMLRDDFARYSDGDPKVPFVVVREALVAALNEWDALAQQPAAVDESRGGWKPIDTAPLGIRVLVWSSTGPNTGGCMMAYRRKTDGQWCREDGTLLAELEGYNGWPAHWQELPPAPAAQQGGAE